MATVYIVRITHSTIFPYVQVDFQNQHPNRASAKAEEAWVWWLPRGEEAHEFCVRYCTLRSMVEERLCITIIWWTKLLHTDKVKYLREQSEPDLFEECWAQACSLQNKEQFPPPPQSSGRAGMQQQGSVVHSKLDWKSVSKETLSLPQRVSMTL